MGIGQEIWESVSSDFVDLLDVTRLTHIVVRLCFAALLGGLLGIQREWVGKEAGLRTHMLVCLGAALFVLVPQLDGMETADMSRVIQGIVTGVGFLGAGTILKLAERQRIRGLTTAAGIWLTAAVGVGVGVGRIGSALVGSVLAFLILALFGRIERLFGHVDERNHTP
jgi:putative Mg2+ transporter-C (MgtC) family protein